MDSGLIVTTIIVIGAFIFLIGALIYTTKQANDKKIDDAMNNLKDDIMKKISEMNKLIKIEFMDGHIIFIMATTIKRIKNSDNNSILYECEHNGIYYESTLSYVKNWTIYDEEGEKKNE